MAQLDAELRLGQYKTLDPFGQLASIFEEIVKPDTISFSPVKQPLSMIHHKPIEVLIGEANSDTTNASAILTELGQGFAMLLVKGPRRVILERHGDFIMDPPLYYRDRDMLGVDQKCGQPNCDVQLMATVAHPWRNSVDLNLFAKDLKPGSDLTTWLLDALVRVNRSGLVASSNP